MGLLTTSLQLGSASALPSITFAGGVGLLGGITSGLCGVSPGGALVVLSTLVLGVEQHVAQGISLAAQIPPTSVSGIQRYRKAGSEFPSRWLLLLTLGLIVGGAIGAICAARVSSSTLQWSYVGYLVILGGLIMLRSSSEHLSCTAPSENKNIPSVALVCVGLLAGLSSGYLGIGGGLAIVAVLVGGLKVPQHRAQMFSLILSLVPTTIPAAYVYWRSGGLVCWPMLLAIIVGLWAGTDLGARAANRMHPVTLRSVLVITVATMTVYMTCKAIEVRP